MKTEQKAEQKTIEVQLVEEVRNCGVCKWFWGNIPPYGDFPVYDWNTDFPSEVKNQKDTFDTAPKRLLTGKVCGMGQVSPGIMHGCRKSPIMTIGINPNMTAYYPSRQGATWAYPHFKSDGRYAYYYRHHSVYQESLDMDFIKRHLIPGSEIWAEKDGWLLDSSRNSSHRWLLLTVRYVGEDSPREIEVSWDDKTKFVLLANTTFQMNPKVVGFTKGTVIGGMISNPAEENVGIFSNGTGYYQRFLYVLDAFREKAGISKEEYPFPIADNVAQHDMIACASPGWNAKYDIPMERITRNCVQDKRYLLLQLVQSCPAIIVIVGGSSLEMFAKVMDPFLTGFDYKCQIQDASGNPISTIKETYQLLKETTEREVFLEINVEEFHLKSRLILSPHFSYADNFRRHCRFSALTWQALSHDFKKDVATLEKEKRIKVDSSTGVAMVGINGKEDEIATELSAAIWSILMAYYYDPIDMIADVLYQEYKAGRIRLDKESGQLARSEGGCKFCRNESWQFPEECPFQKTSQDSLTSEKAKRIVDRIINGKPTEK